VVISELTTIELRSALARKVRTGEITVQAEEEVVGNVDQDCGPTCGAFAFSTVNEALTTAPWP
jgi:hypothetical protein